MATAGSLDVLIGCKAGEFAEQVRKIAQFADTEEGIRIAVEKHPPLSGRKPAINGSDADIALLATRAVRPFHPGVLPNPTAFSCTSCRAKTVNGCEFRFVVSRNRFEPPIRGKAWGCEW